MRLKLKEQPKEWQKFTMVMVAVAGAGLVLLHRRGAMSLKLLLAGGVALALVLLVCAIRPGWFRGFYRVGMTASFCVGLAVGWVTLMLLFLVVVTPLGLLLRLSGKDLLGLKRGSTSSYWHCARPPGPLDRQF